MSQSAYYDSGMQGALSCLGLSRGYEQLAALQAMNSRALGSAALCKEHHDNNDKKENEKLLLLIEE